VELKHVSVDKVTCAFQKLVNRVAKRKICAQTFLLKVLGKPCLLILFQKLYLRLLLPCSNTVSIKR
jgi:hypothetical protein